MLSSESEAKLCTNFCHQLTNCNNWQESILLDTSSLIKILVEDDDCFRKDIFRETNTEHPSLV